MIYSLSFRFTVKVQGKVLRIPNGRAFHPKSQQGMSSLAMVPKLPIICVLEPLVSRKDLFTCQRAKFRVRSLSSILFGDTQDSNVL